MRPIGCPEGVDSLGVDECSFAAECREPASWRAHGYAQRRPGWNQLRAQQPEPET